MFSRPSCLTASRLFASVPPCSVAKSVANSESIGIGIDVAEVLAVVTQSDSSPKLGRYGVYGRGATQGQAKQIEALGYGAIRVGGSPRAELEWVEPLLFDKPHEDPDVWMMLALAAQRSPPSV